MTHLDEFEQLCLLNISNIKAMIYGFVDPQTVNCVLLCDFAFVINKTY